MSYPPLPIEWVLAAHEHFKTLSMTPEGIDRLIDMGMKNEDLSCLLYLETIDQAQWPLLIGINPIMDKALCQALKNIKEKD